MRSTSPSVSHTSSSEVGVGQTPEEVRESNTLGPVRRNSSSAVLLGEVAQAKLRIYLHCFLVILTFTAYHFDKSISVESVIFTSIASFVSAFGLYVWAIGFQNGRISFRSRFYQRAASIVSDNLFITIVLYIGGESTAGVWAIYIWISVGYGVRYGVQYLWVNVVASVLSFLLVAWQIPFWSIRPQLVIGLTLGMIVVPVYTGWLIKQLHIAVREREAAYKAKSEFVARMSHELRTPLHAIISTAELLQGAVSTPKQKDFVNIISVSSSTLLELINRVLDLSKFESGSIALSTEPLNIHTIVSETANIVWPQATQKGVDVRVFTDPNISVELLGSPEQLKELLLNILGNAAKFTDTGHISIAALLHSESELIAAIKFVISDTGCGIPAKDLQFIFEPFVQADSSITRKHGGTGLGTSFSREIVRLMDGDITLSSKEHLGTEVEIVIPFKKPPSYKPSSNFYPLSLLVLDESESNKRLVSLLNKSGAQYRVVHRLDDLLLSIDEAPLANRVDAVFVNADEYGENLPGISQVIRDQSTTRIIPVAAFGDAVFRTAAISSGYCSYFSPECDESILHSVLSTVKSLAAISGDDANSVPQTDKQPTLKILVAEDDATNRKIVKLILEEGGHKCTVVTNGDDALFALNDVQYDVALLDMHMPNRDGVEVAKIYRFSRFDLERPTPIILFTADTTLEAREEAAAAGISRFVTKPIRPSELLDVVYATYRESLPKPVVQSSDISAARSPMKVVSIERNKPPTVQNMAEYINEVAIADLLNFMTKEEQTEFFSDFSDDARKYVGTLETAETMTDVLKAQCDMHALAGAAVTVGAEHLAKMAKEIEALDQSAVLLNKHRISRDLRKYCDATLEEIAYRYI